MLASAKRLHIVTGKGGVGKTVFALSLCKALKESGKKVLYNSFDQLPNQEFCQKLGIEIFGLDIESSAETYIGKKLGSTMIASWVMKTPFFSSLFHMIPGLGHMILLGHLINALEDDPSLNIVIDSPSSGHALTMLEAPHNFKAMFKRGLIVKDIDRMQSFSQSETGARAIILALPTEMAIQEGIELKSSLKDLEINDAQVIMNNSYQDSSLLKNSEELPIFLEKKLSLEKKVKEQFSREIDQSIPHYSTLDGQIIITNMAKEISKND